MLADELLQVEPEFRSGAWWLDARMPRERCVVTHAHADHIGRHAMVLATPETCDFLKHRLFGEGEDGSETGDVAVSQTVALPFGQAYRDGDETIELFSAGHVLGSAMVRITTPRGRLLYTGDFRLKGDALTVPPAEVVETDVLLAECTFGLPRYRFEPRAVVVERLCDLIAASFAEGKQPVCLCYSLGKAQEVAAHLCKNGFAVTMHGAAYAITQLYEAHGVKIGDYRAYEAGKVEGTVLIVPPHVRNSRMITNLANAEIFVITGWAMDTGCKYRHKAQHALAISDHADFDELVEFVQRTRAKEILLTHGFARDFCRTLRGMGLNARLARPPAQGVLFDD